MGYQVKFVQTTQSQYDAIATKESGTLYFTTDTKRIYKGSNLYAATAFDQLVADSIETNQITVDGKNVSLEGHTHTFGDVTGLSDVLSGISSTSISKSSVVANTVSASSGVFSNGLTVNGENVSLEGHTHSEYKTLQTAKSSPTASGTYIAFIDTISQDANGEITATKKTVRSATVNQTGVVQLNDTLTSTLTTQAATANAVKQLNDKFANYVLLSDLEDGIRTSNIQANSVTINGQAPSLEGHTHTTSDITDFPDLSNYVQVEDLEEELEVVELAAGSIQIDGKSPSLEGHTHTTSDITDLPNLSSWESRLQSVESQLVGLESALHEINTGSQS